jgi:radical SAM protein with 4Fe4S-binding SPASM domain
VSAHRADKMRMIRHGAILGRPVTGPMEVGIIPTYACNHGCVFCALAVEPEGKKTAIAIETILPVLDQLAAMDTEQVSITGGGDPLCHPQIDRLIEEVRARDMAVSVCTNGALLNEARVDRWASLGVHLSISLNAASPAVYKRIHRNASEEDFNRVLKMARRFVEKSPEVEDSFVSLNFVACSENSNEVEAIVELGADLGARQVQLRTVQPREIHDDFRLVGNDLERAREQTALAIERFGENLTIQAAGELLDEEAFESFPCLEGYVSSYIDSDGTVFPCCMRRSLNAEDLLGSLDRQSFADIWNGDAYQRFRKMAHAREAAFQQAHGCPGCPKARHFLYLADESSPGNAAIAELESRRLNYELPDSAFLAEIEIVTSPDRWCCESFVELEVRLTNKSNCTWPGVDRASRPVGLGYHLLGSNGEMLRFDNNPRPYLAADLPSGKSALFTLRIEVPDKPGQYELQIEPLQEGVAWFSQKRQEPSLLRFKAQRG